jgi:hypothetical protein
MRFSENSSADPSQGVRAQVVDALGRQIIEHRRAGDAAAVAAERVEAHLVGGDEENFATHIRLRSITHPCYRSKDLDAPNTL